MKLMSSTIVQRNNEFALNLYNHLARAGKRNLFFSPYSISSALAMTFAGTRGSTEQEMADVLRFPAEQDDLHSVFARLNATIFGGKKPDYTIKIANRLCGQQGYQLRAEFLKLLRTSYGADFEQLDFGGQPEIASQKINQWVEEQTAGKITNLIVPEALSELTRLLLVNAVYFKGNWSEKFDEAATKEDFFRLGLLNKVKVQMMHQQASFSYAEADGVQVIELPYGDRDLSMVVLLPQHVGELAKLESALSASNVNKWLTAFFPQSVDVYLPKFRLSEQFVLAAVLKSMGMASAFSDMDADFSGITDQQPGLCISEVIHKAFVEVNEEGTEAAAATAVLAGYVSVPPPVPVFRADHPFVFMIQHNESGSILFMGRVAYPIDAE
jgi:serpin B